jgi:hypothetical protein
MVSIHGECSRASLIDLSAVQIECATEIGKSCDISFSRVVGKVAIFCVELLHSWRCWEMCHGSRGGLVEGKAPTRAGIWKGLDSGTIFDLNLAIVILIEGRFGLHGLRGFDFYEAK